MDKLRIDGHKLGYRNKNLGNDEYRGEHVLVAERILGKRLPAGAEIHHIDGNKRNNTPSNLVICPSREYHLLLHMRERALNACGNASWRHCYYCKEYDALSNLRGYLPKGRTTPFTYHLRCAKDYRDKHPRKSRAR